MLGCHGTFGMSDFAGTACGCTALGGVPGIAMGGVPGMPDVVDIAFEVGGMRGSTLWYFGLGR